MATLKKTCDLCNQTTQTKGDDVLYFGEWMTRSDITVHYYCLLLSTNLPQEGNDHAGILGFRLRDIRKEAKLAKSRNCMYCDTSNATIMCRTCKGYFHLTCGFTSMALSQFQGEFSSYCSNCIPLDNVMKKLQKEPPPVGQEKCVICMKSMGYCEPTRWIYAKCCGNGYAHSKCMKVYALKAGYYLSCIWCKSKRFRDDVKYFGVFVPDRDAKWEREQGAYRDLYCRHQRCDVEQCNCPRGRDYKTDKWSIILCQLCGSFGAHNPSCIPGMEHKKEKILEFKCEACSATERTICSQTSLEEVEIEDDLAGINTTLYIHKYVKPFNPCQQFDSLELKDKTSEISTSSDEMQPTVVHNPPLVKCATLTQTITATHMPSITQCDDTSIRSSERPSSSIRSSERPSSPIRSSEPLDFPMADTRENETDETNSENRTRVLQFLVERMLDIFET